MAKRTKKQVTYRDSFRLYDGKYESFLVFNPESKKSERVRLPEPTPDLESAQSFKRNYEIKLGVAKIRAEKRFNFLQKFNNQELLFDAYTKHRQKVAKRSWQEDVSRMSNYVFPFFIGQMNLNHPSQWFEYWQEFQDSLKKPMRNNTKTKELAVNSKDNIIRAANSFIAFVESKESGTPIKRLPEFKYEEKGRRGIEAVYTNEEILNVFNEFQSMNEPKYASLWLVIANTGMRVGEAISLLSSDVILNSIPQQEKWIFTAIKDKTEIFGYILLKSQCADINHLVLDGKVERVPLKKRKRIAPEFNRVIPLIEIETAKHLKELRQQVSKHNLLFEGCSYRVFYTLFQKIRDNLELKNKDFHSLRHTFATSFTKLCEGDPRIVEKVLGHSDPDMTKRYNHLANELESLTAIDNSQEIKAIKF